MLFLVVSPCALSYGPGAILNGVVSPDEVAAREEAYNEKEQCLGVDADTEGINTKGTCSLGVVERRCIPRLDYDDEGN